MHGKKSIHSFEQSRSGDGSVIFDVGQIECTRRANWGDVSEEITRIAREFGPLDSNRMYNNLEHRVKPTSVEKAAAPTGILVANLFGSVITTPGTISHLVVYRQAVLNGRTDGKSGSGASLGFWQTIR
jgi:hypothetical protein